MDKERISVIIPAYEPDEKLIGTLKELTAAGFEDILVVNDGSSPSCQTVFEQVKNIQQCTLLEHPVNRGKGAALKTAFSFFLAERPEKAAAVTADADGQHLTKDIEAVADTCVAKEAVVLGVRDFSQPQVPPKSRMGNRITSGVLRLFFGMKIQDTQTGLRAFPRKYLETVLKAEGERYEYETNMLFVINKYKIPLEQVEIETVYIDENKSSHFRVVRDSLRVYGLILKYLCSSVGASLVDVFAYYILKRLAWLAFLPVPLTFSCAFLARVISSLFNYFINAKVVFKGKTGGRTIVRYYALAVLQIGVSALAVFGMEHVLHITTPGLSTVLKAIVDTILFFISFRVQHKWVFKEEQ